jgi:hypothetical protein
MLAQGILLIASFYEIGTIWKRDLATVHEILASPTPRGASCQAR